MKFYVKLIILIVPLILVLAFSRLAYLKNSNGLNEKGVLRVPLLYRIVPIAVFMFCVFISLYILLFQFEDWPYILLMMGAIGLPFLVMFIMCSLWKVEIKDDSFLYRNFFGKKTEYEYNALEYKQHPKGLKWFFYKDGKKVFCMAYYIKNGDALYKRWKKRTR